MILLYYLGFVFTLITIPLFLLVIYLIKQTSHNGKVEQLRKVIIRISFAKILFILAEILTVIISLLGMDTTDDLVIILFVIVATNLCAVNWWALFKIRTILRGV